GGGPVTISRLRNRMFDETPTRPPSLRSGRHPPPSGALRAPGEGLRSPRSSDELETRRFAAIVPHPRYVRSITRGGRPPGAVQVGSLFGDQPQKPAIPSTLPAVVGAIVRA